MLPHLHYKVCGIKTLWRLVSHEVLFWFLMSGWVFFLLVIFAHAFFGSAAFAEDLLWVFAGAPKPAREAYATDFTITQPPPLFCRQRFVERLHLRSPGLGRMQTKSTPKNRTGTKNGHNNSRQVMPLLPCI